MCCAVTADSLTPRRTWESHHLCALLLVRRKEQSVAIAIPSATQPSASVLIVDPKCPNNYLYKKQPNILFSNNNKRSCGINSRGRGEEHPTFQVRWGVGVFIVSDI